MSTLALPQATRRSEWWIPAGLIALSLVPALAGSARVAELARGAPMTADNARFVMMPLPVVLHVLAAIPFSMIGAFQFAPGFRRRHRVWHRTAGKALVAMGLVFVLVGKPGETERGVMMGAGWVINVVVAEWIIRRRKTPRAGTQHRGIAAA
ncbi:MAG: DUF2306 domain-containing protein [Gemmatimonadetes bacterium]|nr:DUF2306 domain-containing protein [Gemmatimonadota bacterium]